MAARSTRVKRLHQAVHQAVRSSVCRGCEMIYIPLVTDPFHNDTPFACDVCGMIVDIQKNIAHSMTIPHKKMYKMWIRDYDPSEFMLQRIFGSACCDLIRIVSFIQSVVRTKRERIFFHCDPLNMYNLYKSSILDIDSFLKYLGGTLTQESKMSIKDAEVMVREIKVREMWEIDELDKYTSYVQWLPREMVDMLLERVPSR